MRNSYVFRLSTAMAATALLLLVCAPCAAQQIPDQGNSGWVWTGLTSEDRVTACPQGDGTSAMIITVLDGSGVGIPDIVVEIALSAGIVIEVWPPDPIRVTTGAEGDVTVNPRVGFSRPGYQHIDDCYLVATSVVADPDGHNVPILFEQTDPMDSREWRSFDMNADGYANGGLGPECGLVRPYWGDYGIFAGDYTGTGDRCDFNEDGFVNLADLAVMNMHMGYPAVAISDPELPYDECSLVSELLFEFEHDETDVQSQRVYINNMGPYQLDWNVAESFDWLSLSPGSGWVVAAQCTCGLSPDSRDEVWVNVDPNLIAVGTEETANLVVAGTSPYDHGNRLTVIARKAQSEITNEDGTAFTGDMPLATTPGIDVCGEIHVHNHSGDPMWWNVVEESRCDWTGPDPAGGLAYQGLPSEIDFCTDPLPPPGHYQCGFRLQSGDPVYPSRPINVELDVDATGVGELSVTWLDQNVPNPFNPQTAIAYSVGEKSRVTLDIYDLSGKHVRTLVDGERRPERYEVMWDACDDNGERVASGVYYYRLEVGGRLQTRKMVLLK